MPGLWSVRDPALDLDVVWASALDRKVVRASAPDLEVVRASALDFEHPLLVAVLHLSVKVSDRKPGSVRLLKAHLVVIGRSFIH